MNNQQRMTEQQFRKQTKERQNYIYTGEEQNLRAEFNKRIKSLKLNKEAKEELFIKFQDCFNNGFLCAYCNKRMELKWGTELSFTLDHFIPKSKGGGNTLKNLVFVCRTCNFLKGEMPTWKYISNLNRLKERKREREFRKARKATEKDKGLREAYKDIFQIVNIKREMEKRKQ